jgi:hypothetical protein
MAGKASKNIETKEAEEGTPIPSDPEVPALAGDHAAHTGGAFPEAEEPPPEGDEE